MTDAAIKKAEISSLWGIPIDQIDTKLNTLKLIITDSTDCSLLDLLLKSDLNIETAVARHFGGNTPSPSPQPANIGLADDDTASSLNVEPSSTFVSSSAPSNSPPSNPCRRRKIPPQPTVPLDSVPSNSSHSTNSKSNPAHCHRSETVDPPPRKKRKLNQSEIHEMSGINESIHSNSDNTNNSNISNSNASSITDPTPTDIDSMSSSKSKVPLRVDRNWRTKKMGTVRVIYEDIVQRNKAQNVPMPQHSERILNRFSAAKVRTFYELQQSGKKGLIRVISTSPSFCDDKRILWEELEGETGSYTQAIFNTTNRGRKLINKDSFEYAVDVDVVFRRDQTSTMKFETEYCYPLCIAAFSNSEQIKTETLKCDRILKEYKDKGHSFSMQSLLDFSCRYSHDHDDRSDNYNHGLNLTLHQYQLQSLRWMLEEENHPNGFYRHLYYEGCFGDDAPFIYSPVLNRLIFSGTIPVAHGGLLCEEMGLGKTIISLALIHAQKPRDLSGYSTRHNMIVSHRKTVRKSRRDMSDPKNPRWIGVNEEYKWYKSAATLIIAPCSLVAQWEKECDERCEGRLKWKRYHSSNRSRRVQDYIDKDIVFTTYGIMAKEKGEDRRKHVLQQIEWNRVILDESHSIKNPKCGQSQSVAMLRAKYRWCLTGTPFGTKVIDLENQLKFIGMRSEDLKRLKLKEVSGDDTFQSKNPGSLCIREAKPLMNLIGRVMMRHKKEQQFNGSPIVSMPEKEETEIFIEFNATQRIFYDKLFKAAKERYNYYASINSVSRASLQILSSLHPPRSACSGFVCSKDEIEEKLSDAETQTFRIQSMVQQMANRNVSSKELFEMAAEEAFAVRDGECPICFECPLDDPLQTPCRHVFCGECIMDILREKGECPMCRRRVNPTDLKKPKKQNKDDDDEDGGEVERKLNDDRERSDDIIRFDAKINQLIAELTRIKRNRPNEKSLIFTSFTKSLDWICSELKRNGFSYRTLTGNMTMNKRKKQLDQFANDDDVKVFVLTVRAGAVGITLTAANHVFMMEPTLNPALHRQAINRVYRLGQRRKVMIHTMIMRDSIEDRIWKVIHKGNGRSDNIAGNINDDRRATLNVVDKLFQ